MPSTHNLLKKEWEIRVVLRGVPREIPIEEVKENLSSQKLPVQRRKPLSSKSKACVPSPELKRSSPANALYLGSVTTSNPTDTRPNIVLNLRVALNAWETTAQRNTRNKDTHGPSACVLYKQKGHTANYQGCPRASKRAPPLEKAAPRLAPARAFSTTQVTLAQRLEYAGFRP
ncbi:hypothetical protein EVAR_25857_1 [Eumeta japonica]|uniref:Uncharacterized protein n=1 Tax=Eumeta variegata TaxID=151549 RepID=A0A4C1X8W9_EUMVA|nr:hypothetical protein EVAR_25857_1 [Eumeta japonica]